MLTQYFRIAPLCFLFISMLMSRFLPAQEHMAPEMGYIENRGQWEAGILYKAELHPSAVVFVEKGSLTFHLAEASHTQKDPTGKNHYDTIRGHAFRLSFLDADFSRFQGRNPSEDVLNFFTDPDPVKWKSGVRKFREVIFHDIYPFVDIRFLYSEGMFKYDLICRPGADLHNLRILYEGLEGLQIHNQELVLETSLGSLKEQAPVCWIETETDSLPIVCRYQLEENLITFDCEGTDSLHGTLVIDPQLIFSTYSGSFSDNWGFTGTYDALGNVYSGGIVFGLGYPVSLGAYQQAFAGGCDVGILKYNPQGTQRLYATYLGGQFADLPHSMMVNAHDELVIFGTTGSPNFPVTTGAYDVSFNGGTYLNYASLVFPQGSDLFVSTLSADGSQLIASTFIGGSGNDGLNFRQRYSSFLTHGNDSLYYNYGDGARGELITDTENSVYVGSCTFSADFPVTPEAIQPQTAGKQEGIILKLDRFLSQLIWSTYFGGSQDDAVYSVDVDEEGDVYFAGGTYSPDLPVLPGAFQMNRQGGSADGFAGHISAGGQWLIGSTYFGSPAYDQAYFIRTGRDQKVYLFGQTCAIGNSMVFNASWSQPNSGQFLACLSDDLNIRHWSTVFGTGNGKPNLSPTAFMIDRCQRLYVSGWGRIWGNSFVNGIPYPWGSVFGTSGLPVTPDAVQPVTDGQDFYVAVVAEGASGLEYGTFFGELYYPGCSYSGHDHVDGGTSRFDPMGNIVQSVCASCGHCQHFPVHPNPGAWSLTNNSSNCNNAVFKISLKNDFALANFANPPGGCTPHGVQFENRSRGTSFLWDFGDTASGASNVSVLPNPSHTYQQAGLYTVTLISYLPGSCNGSDTLHRTLLVLSDTTTLLDTLTLCGGGMVQIGITPPPDTGLQYQWSPPIGLSDPTVPNPFANPSQSTLYQCLVTAAACTDTLLQFVRVLPLEAHAGNDTLSCNSIFLLKGSSSTSGSLFHWSSQAVFSDTLNNFPYDSTALVDLLQYPDSNFYLRVFHPAGCQDEDEVAVQYEGVLIQASSSRWICAGDTVHLHALIQNQAQAVAWNWEPQAWVLSGGQTAHPVVQPDSSGWFVVSAITPAGCYVFDSVYVGVSYIRPGLVLQPSFCYDNCTGWASVSPQGGQSPYGILFSNGFTGSPAQQLCPGDYWVMVTDSVGCDTLQPFIISSPDPFLIVEETVSIHCHGDSSGSIGLNVSGGTPPYLFQWSNGMNGPAISGLPAGNYGVWITDANDCDTFRLFILEEPQPYSFYPSMGMVSCYGLHDGFVHLLISGATPPYTVSWSNGVSGMFVTGLPAGIYTALVSDSLSCDTTLTFEITQPAQILPTALIQDVSCAGFADGSITVSVSGGSEPYAFLWTTGDTLPLIMQLQQGEYGLRITDFNGCIYDTVFSVAAPLPIDVEAFITHVSCRGNGDGSIALEVSGGVQPFEMLWTNGQTGPVISGLDGGEYSVTVTDAHSCDTSVQYRVEEADELFWAGIIVKNPECAGDSNGILSLMAGGGKPPYLALWSTGDTGMQISDLPAGHYSLEVTDAYGCRVVLDTVLTDASPLLISATIVSQTCGGGLPDGSISLVVEGGEPPVQFQWAGGQTTSEIESLAAGQYSVVATDKRGCKQFRIYTVSAPPPLKTLEIVTPCRCPGSDDGQVLLVPDGGTPPYRLQWQNHGDQNPFVELLTGLYFYFVTDSRDCFFSDSVFISEPEPMVVIKHVSPALCEGTATGSVSIEITGGTPLYQVIWSDGISGENRYHLTSGDYLFNITDSRGCSLQDTVRVKEISCQIVIPNVITPNGDGWNDHFIIRGIEFFPDNELIIYNRWGTEILQFRGYKNEWDGRTASGEEVSEGVYYFLLRLSDGRTFQGSVTVMR